MKMTKYAFIVNLDIVFQYAIYSFQNSALKRIGTVYVLYQ